MSALDTQVGGDHYKKLAIQPVEFIMANNIGYLEGNIIKYVTRYKDKGGLRDLEKAQHYLSILIEMLNKKAKADMLDLVQEELHKTEENIETKPVGTVRNGRLYLEHTDIPVNTNIRKYIDERLSGDVRKVLIRVKCETEEKAEFVLDGIRTALSGTQFLVTTQRPAPSPLVFGYEAVVLLERRNNEDKQNDAATTN